MRLCVTLVAPTKIMNEGWDNVKHFLQVGDAIVVHGDVRGDVVGRSASGVAVR